MEKLKGVLKLFKEDYDKTWLFSSISIFILGILNKCAEKVIYLKHGDTMYDSETILLCITIGKMAFVISLLLFIYALYTFVKDIILSKKEDFSEKDITLLSKNKEQSPYKNSENRKNFKKSVKNIVEDI